MSAPLGFGRTGESFFVGADHTLRNDSQRTPENDILKARFETPAVDAALAGGRDIPASESELRGAKVLTAVVPFVFGDSNWALVTVIDTAEAMAPLNEMRDLILKLAVGVLVGAAVLGYLFSLSITRPLGDLTRAMDALAEGDL